jgi:hypothetical protein
MAERNVPREYWSRFCERFSRQHRGWMVTMGLFDTERLDTDSPATAEAPRILGSDVILQGVAAVQNGRGIDLSITAADERDRLARILLHSPVRLRFERASSGAHQGLRIDTATGQTLLIHFRAAARPDLVNGMAETTDQGDDQNA